VGWFEDTLRGPVDFASAAATFLVVNWKLKVLVQFVLAHVPGGEAVNHRLQRRAGSHSVARSRVHVDDIARFLTSIDPPVDVRGKRILEVGTGWDAIHALVLSILGASSVTTYDHVRHVRFDLAMQGLQEIARHPMIAAAVRLDESARERLDDLLGATDLDDLLARGRITYVAPGDATTSGLAAGSIDIVYSHAVLEHVTDKVVDAFLTESQRVLVPGGVILAVIGIGDHYTSVDPSLTMVNFLKYPEWLWALLVKNKISYHNRLREKDFLDRFERAGARVLWKFSRVDDRDVEAARTMRVNRRFAGLTPEQLAVSRTDVVLDFPNEPAVLSLR
jgi:SAM-dependent methyltransferase